MPLTTKHQVLAWDLVEGLGDKKHKGIYFRLAKTHNEGLLREVLSIVKTAYKEGKIKADDRGRYFMGILKKEKHVYGKSFKNNSRRKPGSAKKSRNDKKSKFTRNAETY